MNALASERQTRWNYEIVAEMPRLSSIVEPVILGTFSWNLTKSKKRIIHRSGILDIGFGPQTAPEIARDYIAAVFPGRLRAYNDQRLEIIKPRTHVLHAELGRIIKGVYLDVSAAYWTIARIVGYNLDYYPGHWLGQGRHMEDFPLPNHKVARSSIISQGLIRPILMWNGKQLVEPKKTGNKHVNFGLHALVQDVLHGVAMDMLELGAKYANTDGFILPYHNLDAAREAIYAWGLNCKIKRDEHGNDAIGLSYIYGVGRYAVGKVHTKIIGFVPDGDFTNINRTVDRDWLRPRMKAASDRRFNVG